MPEKIAIVMLQFIFLIYLPTIFQTSMLISPLWLFEGDGTYRGMKSQLLEGSKTPDYNVKKVLDGPTYCLLLLATVLLWIQAVIFSIVGIIILKKRPSLFCVKLFSKGVYVGIWMYIIASFVSLAACIRFASMFPMKQIGSAFYFNMAIFCYIWLIVLVFICDHIFKRRNDANVCSTLICGLKEKCENDENSSQLNLTQLS